MNFDAVPPNLSASWASNAGLAPALSANVLVLNRFYQAIRVVNVRRAFSLLFRDLAEVIHIETDHATGQSKWQNLAFTEWAELSELKRTFEPDAYDWIHTVRIQIAVPRVRGARGGRARRCA